MTNDKNLFRDSNLSEGLEQPEQALALAWIYATQQRADSDPPGSEWDAVNALVNLSRELRAVHDWRNQ